MSGKLSAIRSTTDICADCGSSDPLWVLINRGVFVCDECCSIHRSLGRHISQIKHLKKSQWSPTLLAMVHALNNSHVNALWEHTLCDPKSPKRKPQNKDVLHPTKADFIRNKYQQLAFVLRSSDTEEELDQQLHSSVRTGNLETSLRLLAQGADPNYYHEEKGNRPIHVAARAGQVGQVELLAVWGADPGALDSAGNTPSACARLSGHREVSQRLLELLYEVTDRLTYFLCRRRPDHSSSQHLLVPEIADCSPPDTPKEARLRLQQLPNPLFEDLAMDVYDEVDRREVESIWVATASSVEPSSVPFLPVNPELSTMRNQGRQKLARFSPREFAALVIDMLSEAKRRQTPTERQSMRAISDEEPLYDSVASDEDYATAEQIAALVAQNQKGGEKPVLSASPVRSVAGVQPSSPTTAPASSVEDELRARLSASQLRIVQLAAEVHRLNLKVEEMGRENAELRSASQHNSLTVTETEPVSDVKQRPVSMYETRESVRAQAGAMPQAEEVVRRTDQVTKRIQELWAHMQAPDTRHAFVPCAERIRVAVAELTAIFPQPGDEVVRTALRQLNTSTVRLQAECAGLESSAERVRSCAYSMAKATRQLLTRFQ